MEYIMSYIFFFGIFLIPCIALILIITAYRIPIKELETRGIEVTQELKKEIKKKFMIWGIIFFVIMCLAVSISFIRAL